MMNAAIDFNARLTQIQRLLDKAEYSDSATRCMLVIEQALRQVAAQYIDRVDESVKQKVLEGVRKRNQKTLDKLTMGQLVYVFQESGFLDACAQTAGKDLSSLSIINLEKLTQLRNKFIHNAQEATPTEAEFLLHCLKVIVTTFDLSELPEKPANEPSAETTATPATTNTSHLPGTFHNRVVEFLTALPMMESHEAQLALLYRAGLEPELQEQIDLAGPPGQFFQLLVPILSKYGTLQDGRHALQAVLEAAKANVGQEGRAQGEQLLRELHSVLARTPSAAIQPETEIGQVGRQDQREADDQGLAEVSNIPFDQRQATNNVTVHGDGNITGRNVTIGDGNIIGSRIKIKTKTVTERVDVIDQIQKLKKIEKEEALEKGKRSLKWRAAQVSILLITFLALSLGFFDLLALDARFEELLMGMSDLLQNQSFQARWLKVLFPAKKPFAENIAIVAVSAATEKTLGDYKPAYRKHHAVLVDQLSRAGAKIIAFDMTFTGEEMLYDQKFADAIQSAKQRGTAVLVGAEEIDGDIPKIVSTLQTAVTNWGMVCGGGKLETMRAIPLAVIKKETGQSLPALVLTIFETNQGLNDRHINEDELALYQIFWSSKEAASIKFSDLELIKKSAGGCPIIKEGDKVANLMIDFSPLANLRDPARRYAYEKIVQQDILKPEELKEKIVLVGRESSDDFVRIAYGIFDEERYGFEIHADALNTLFNHIRIYKLEPSWQIVIMIVLGSWGASLGYKIKRPYCMFLLLASLLTYLVLSIGLYMHLHILLSTLYHACALSLTCWAGARLKTG